MAARFVKNDVGLPERIGHDGSAQASPYRGPRGYRVDRGEVCLFLTCLEPTPHDHAVCWLCEALRYGNAFCPACRAFWDPTPGVLELRLRDRSN